MQNSSPNDEKEKNGCMYRHALPPGFVLRSQRKAMEAAARADVISLEEFIEVEVQMTILPIHVLHLTLRLWSIISLRSDINSPKS